MLKKIFTPVSLIVLMAGLTGLGMVLYAWRLPPFSSSVEMTDNAYVRGYVTLLSPQVSGYIVDVPVKDYQDVKQGDILARVDDRSYVQKLAQAKATLDGQKASLANSDQKENAARANISSSEASIESAQAALKQAQLASDRQDNLTKSGVGTSSTQEEAHATLEKAKAALLQAKAALEVSNQDLQTIIVNRGSLEAAVASAEASVQLAEIDLGNTVIRAPRDGKVGEVGARLGQYVTAGTQLMAVVPTDVWVIANFKETQLAGMQVGQPVSISVDAMQRREIRGHVERFSPAAGSEFSVIKPDNATGNFVKIAQRIGVRVAIDPGQDMTSELSPGMSVVVRVDKSKAPEAVHSVSN
ncbi:HlyD family secretion protein [Rhizobium sp. CG4]|jgi:multidrug resistance efflux pump|uniref:HlyD family secretion protein n=1 Tax=Rhizobium/Agrobacterium group TaxID=227290 RepID=UPI0020349B19|nr:MULTISPECIES: HlyD family secretion protein [Rhizobium/Agrobacterium group]MCM2455439.1 HlyD family secretion protein [Rhizobium sp. CG4]MDO5894985.1 HlyD family secretion protein [Agrobacterium sp. Azo12]